MKLLSASILIIAAYTICVIATPVAQSNNFFSPASVLSMYTRWIDTTSKMVLDLMKNSQQTTTSMMSLIPSGQSIFDNAANGFGNVTSILADAGKSFIGTMNQVPISTNNHNPMNNTNNSTGPSA